MADMASNKPNLQQSYYPITIVGNVEPLEMTCMVTEDSILVPVMKTLFFKRLQKQLYDVFQTYSLS